MDKNTNFDSSKIHGKHRKTWVKTQTSIIKYMEEKFTEKKNPRCVRTFC